MVLGNNEEKYEIGQNRRYKNSQFSSRIHNFWIKFTQEPEEPSPSALHNMTLGLKTIALLAPSFVTLFWAAILFIRNNSSRNPGFYIAAQMLTFFLVFTSILPYYTGNTRLYLLLEPAFFLAVCMIFPLTWFYVRAVTCRKGARGKELLHLVPAIALAAAAVIYPLLIDADYWFQYGAGQPYPATTTLEPKIPYLVNYGSKGIVILQIPLYFLLSYRLISRHRAQVKDYFSGLNRFYFNWIRLFYITYPGASILGLFLLLNGNSNLDHTPEPLLVAVFFLLSGIFFVIAYIANHQRYIENGEFYRVSPCEESNSVDPAHFPDGLNAALEKLFREQRPYLQHDLKITDVAGTLGTNRTYVSRLIRSQYHTNFSGFVNAFRVKEAIRLFGHEKFRNYTTKSIAEAAGFNNYNSFSEAFRKETGVTPGKYREHNR